MDALAMLVRPGTIAVLWQLARLGDVPVRRTLRVVAAGAGLCIAAAIAGGHFVRHLS